MRGKVKNYNEKKGFGFILGEDGEDRFFHISSLKSFDKPLYGAVVEFISEQGVKGLVAKNIIVKTEEGRHEFIAFGNVRIKLSNIKDYGLSKYEYEYDGEQRYRKYLYVTTYQKDNYEFYEKDVSFNIFKKCNELDQFYGVKGNEANIEAFKNKKPEIAEKKEPSTAEKVGENVALGLLAVTFIIDQIFY